MRRPVGLVGRPRQAVECRHVALAAHPADAVSRWLDALGDAGSSRQPRHRSPLSPLMRTRTTVRRYDTIVLESRSGPRCRRGRGRDAQRSVRRRDSPWPFPLPPPTRHRHRDTCERSCPSAPVARRIPSSRTDSSRCGSCFRSICPMPEPTFVSSQTSYGDGNSRRPWVRARSSVSPSIGYRRR